MNRNAGSDVLEIDAIGVDEWEHEQHTPRAMDENLAALVKQSSAAQSGPVRAPTLGSGEAAPPVAAAPAEQVKQRTTTNTVARAKTMALPTIAVTKPAAPAAKPAAPAAKPAAPAAKPAAPAAKPAAAPSLAATPAAPAAKPVAPAAFAPKPATPKPVVPSSAVPKPAAPTPAELKPVAAKIAAKPPSTAAAKPAAKPTPPSIAAVDPKPAAKPTPPPPVAVDPKPEGSIIVDLDAAPSVDKPRPHAQPAIQPPAPTTPAMVPIAAPPSAAPAVAPIAAPPSATPAVPESDRSSSPSWHTPLPQRAPGEPLVAPVAPSWPSATGLVYEPREPLVHEPREPLAHEPAAPFIAQRPIAASPLRSLVRRRGVVLAIAGAAVLAIAIAIGAHGSSEPKQATPAAKTGPIASADAPSSSVTAPAPTGAAPAPATTAAVEPVAPSPKPPGKRPVATPRISRRAKPVVVDYDKKPSSSPTDGDGDKALAQARAEYSVGNQHLFAGENREAIAAYRRALAIYPGYAAGYRGLGLAFTELDDKRAALAAFKTYVKLAPSARDIALIQKRIRSLSGR